MEDQKQQGFKDFQDLYLFHLAYYTFYLIYFKYSFQNGHSFIFIIVIHTNGYNNDQYLNPKQFKTQHYLLIINF